MAPSTPPLGFRGIAGLFVQEQAHGLVNVMGVVSDFMPATKSNGPDWQSKFTLHDKDSSIRVKFFRPQDDLPPIRGMGDVVLLRNVKLNQWRGIPGLLSNHSTESIVFPAQQHDFETMTTPFTSSVKGLQPTDHEIQYANFLKRTFAGLGSTTADSYNTHSTLQKSVTLPTPPPSVAKKSDFTAPTPSLAQNLPTAPAPGFARSYPKEKFSLIKNISGGARAPRSGNFYDLAVEVVKIYPTGIGFVHMYVCDYTTNHDLRNQASSAGWNGPTGQMNLPIEVYPPNDAIVLENIKEGDMVYLTNVRVKWNKSLSELEANIWATPKSGAPAVERLTGWREEKYKGEIEARRRSYSVNVQGQRPGKSSESKAPKRKLHQREANQAQNQESKRVMHIEPPSTLHTANNVEAQDLATVAKVYKTNPNGDIPISSFREAFLSRSPWLRATRGNFLAPFNNVKHRLRLRIVDFYPHNLEEFTQYLPLEDGTGERVWAWCFWLVVVDGDENAVEPERVHVLVSGSGARELLNLEPAELSRDEDLYKRLEQRLFFLWGELAERKDKFLHAHPQIKADEDFSAQTYNITTDNLPIDACVAEFGIPAAALSKSGLRLDSGWARLIKLFGTLIKT